MQYLPSEMERRYRLCITGRGDSSASLFRCLREEGGSSGAWAAHALSRIYFVKGRIGLARSFLDLSVRLFEEEPGGDIPLELGIQKALILWSMGDTAGAERILREILQRSIACDRTLLAADAASHLAMILARTGRTADAGSLNGMAETCYRVMNYSEGLVRVELNGALIEHLSDRSAGAIDRIADMLSRPSGEITERERASAAVLLAEIFLAEEDLERAGEALLLAYSYRRSLRRFRPIRLRLIMLTGLFRSRTGDGARAGRLEGKAERMRIMLGLNGLDCRAAACPSRVGRGRGSVRVSRRAALTARSVDSSSVRFITADSHTQNVLMEIERAAPLSVPMLIRGETGVGKELVSRMIHEWSGRGKAPFVPVNAAALTRGLFESTLFGHKRGAFTGAATERPGLLSTVGAGTLFLDEVAELDIALQAKLLRFLDNGEYLPLGSDKVRFSNARLVAATNRDLESLVKAGAFRNDLLYRLSVLTFSIPPLRARRSDIMALADHFLSKASIRTGLGYFAISDEARALLESYDWPGNVRELESEMLRAIVRAREGLIRVCHLSARVIRYLPEVNEQFPGGLDRRIIAFEYGEIERALRASGGNRSEAARMLGLKRTTLLYRMKRHGIDDSDDPSRID